MSSAALLQRSWVALGRPGENVSFDAVAKRWRRHGRPYHGAFDYHKGIDDRDTLIAHASSDQVCLLSRDHEFLKALPFWQAFSASEDTERTVACVCVGSGTEPDEILVAASMDHRVAVWAATSSTTKKWRVHSTLALSHGTVTSLDIHKGQLLIGSISSLSLWRLGKSGIGIWRRTWLQECPSPIRLAHFSPDASFIAAATERGQNVVLWSVPRKSGQEPVFNQQIFHPCPVSLFTWRQPPDSSSQSEVLVTWSSDGVARIWASVIDEPTKLRLWTTLESPRNLPCGHTAEGRYENPRRPFYMDAAAVSQALKANVAALNRELQMMELGVGSQSTSRNPDDMEMQKDIKRTRLRRLEQILSEAPDMFLSFADDGYLTVTAVANIDRRPPTLLQTFTVLKLPPCLSVPAGQIAEVTLIPKYANNGASDEDAFATLQIRTLLGTPLAFGLNPALFFDGRGSGLTSCGAALPVPSIPSPDAPGSHVAHAGRIARMVRSSDGRRLASSSASDLICWDSVIAKDQAGKVPQRLRALGYAANQPSELLAISDDNAFCAIVCDGRLGLKIIRSESAVGETVWTDLPGVNLCALTFAHFGSGHFIVACTTDAFAYVWRFDSSDLTAVLISQDQLPWYGSRRDVKLAVVTTVEGCGLTGASASHFVTITTAGVLERWAMKCKEPSHPVKIAWHRTAYLNIDTQGITQACCSASGLNAIISSLPGRRQLLNIYDSSISAFTSGLEHRQEYDADDPIMAMDWSPSTLMESTLAIAFSHHVDVLGPMRHQIPVDGDEACTARWGLYVRADLSGCTSSKVRDVAWLANERLAIGSASLVYVYGPLIGAGEHVEDMSERRKVHIAEVIAERTGPLPQYHPTFLHECLHWNNMQVAKTIICNLRQAITSASASDIEETWDFKDASFDQFSSVGSGSELGRRINAVGDQRANGASIFNDASDSESSDDELNSKNVHSLLRSIETFKLPHLDSKDVQALRTIIKTTLEAEEQKRSLDDNGLRYLVSLRLLLNRSEGVDLPDGQALEDLSHRDILWAFHSDHQEPLLAAIKTALQNKITWPMARSTGLFMWLKSQQVVRAQAELVARAQFMVGEDRDPIKCSLLYFALGKYKVVLGLWKQAVWHPEQKKMLQFLSHDFEDERWRTAAQKNAFALLSQRRYEFAASFFMLGDSLRDAVNVCVQNLHDIGLAIALARIREGSNDGPVFTDLLKTRVLPRAFEQGQRWLASWAFWMLKRRDLAVRVILTPLTELLADPEVAAMLPGNIECSDGHYDDASLAILYKQLKNKTLQTMKGVAAISEKKEFDFVLHMNKVLCQMGCHTLGLNLLRTWVFEPPVVASSTTQYHAVTKEDLHTISRVDGAIADESTGVFTLDFDTHAVSHSPTRLRRRDSEASMSPPSSPRVTRRRSSLLRRRSSIVNDLDIGKLQAQIQQDSERSVSTPSIGRLPPANGAEANLHPTNVIMEEPQAIADEPVPVAATNGEQKKADEDGQNPSKPKGVGVFKSAAASNATQGAQEFDFGSFGF